MAELSDSRLNRKMADSATVAKQVDGLEAQIAELRQAYEQFFLGLERKPPTFQHNDLKRQLQQMRGTFVRQTAVKFRINALLQKFATYERLWARTLNEIESGTYRRDLYKVRRQKQEREAAQKPDAGPRVNELPSPDDLASSLDEALAEVEITAPKAPTPARGVAAAPSIPAVTRPVGTPPVPPPGTQLRVTPTGTAPVARPPAAAAGAGAPPLSDAKLRAVYDAYLTAKKRCQEDTSKLNYEQVAANLRKQVPELMKKANANSVEFKIVIKDGKAVLRAIPK